MMTTGSNVLMTSGIGWPRFFPLLWSSIGRWTSMSIAISNRPGGASTIGPPKSCGVLLSLCLLVAFLRFSGTASGASDSEDMLSMSESIGAGL